MKIKMLKALVIKGSVWPAGSILELPDPEAAALIEQKSAVEVKEAKPAWEAPSQANSIPVPSLDPKDKKKPS